MAAPFLLTAFWICACGRTTVNKKALIHNIIPINDMVHRPLLKCFKKSPKNFHDKAVQSNILWLNLNKIGAISILQSAHKQGNPSFQFRAPGSKRRYPCTQTASAVKKYFPCLLQFCTGYRIWHTSRVWERKTLIDTQLQISRYNQHFFAIRRRILIKWPLTYLP